MLYQFYEFSHAAVAPWRQAAVAGRDMLRNSANPFVQTLSARATAAACEMFARATRRYAKPEFGIDKVTVGGVETPLIERVVARRPFGDLVWFERQGAHIAKRNDPKVLLVAPMSGHFATLLRGTVAALAVDHEVFVTDWTDARMAPISAGRFGLDEYVDYVVDFLQVLHARDGQRAAAIGVCQPSVPLLCAAALMAEDKNPARPSAIVLMGGPVDPRLNPTEPNRLASTRPLSWFRNNVITTVTWPHPGFLRRVYPGFLQLSGFMAMNLDRHVDAHLKQFRHLVRGDGDSATAHRKFYDEYLSVMDLTAEFYLDTIERVFQRFDLPCGQMRIHDRPVRPEAITDIALMTVEGANDDITGLGQTKAAHTLASQLPDHLREHYTHPDVGHYGVFNGGKWRNDIRPRVAEFIAKQQ